MKILKMKGGISQPPSNLSNKRNERKNKKVNEKNGALLLSLFRLEVWFFSQVSDALPILLLLT
jgi:hypothetical protein